MHNKFTRIARFSTGDKISVSPLLQQASSPYIYLFLPQYPSSQLPPPLSLSHSSLAPTPLPSYPPCLPLFPYPSGHPSPPPPPPRLPPSHSLHPSSTDDHHFLSTHYPYISHLWLTLLLSLGYHFPFTLSSPSDIPFPRRSSVPGQSSLSIHRPQPRASP